MISGFRKSLRSWATVALLFLALMAIVVTGFGTGGFGGIGSLGGAGGGSATELASVDGRPVNGPELSDMVTRGFNQARAQTPTLDMATYLSQGAYEETLKQMITIRALRNYAEARGLTVSARMIDREIVNIPAFRNFAGQFDPSAFRAALARENITEERLRDDIGRSLMQRQLLGPVALGARVPEGVAREYASLLLERRRGTIGLIPAAALAQGLDPSDAELASFYRRNRRAFTLPERRVIKYALIGAEQIRAPVTASEAEIQAAYRANAAQYGPRETRTVQAIVLPTQAAAQAFAARVRGGTGFVDAASQAGFSAGDVTFADQQRAQFAAATAPQAAAAAFAAAQGAVAGPIRSDLGYHVVRVERINATPARPLEAVRAELAAAIERQKRNDALAALIARVEDQLSEGASFEEAARGAGLAIVTTPPVDAQGRAAGGQPYVAPPELARLLRSAFDMDAEDPEPAVEPLEANVRYALLGVDRVDPAAPPPLAQISDRVRSAYIQVESMRRAKALADRIVARINAGTPAARAFAEAQPRAQMSAVDMQRLEISHRGQRPPPPLLVLFSIPQGHARAIRADNGQGWHVVAHEQLTPGNAAGNADLIRTTRTEFSSSASEELAQQFARSVEMRAAIIRNQEAIRRGRLAAAGGAAPTEGEGE